MEFLNVVLTIIKPGVWMVSVDLHDAYYTISVHTDHQNTFDWHYNYYKCTCLPNDYAQAPMIFTKLLTRPFSFLGRRGDQSVIYIDCTYMQGYLYNACYNNI